MFSKIISTVIALSIGTSVAFATRSESWPIPHITEDTLSNGLRILYARVNDVPLMELNLIINAGTMHEPPEKAGIAELTQRLLLRGTVSRREAELRSYLSLYGSSLTTSTTIEFTQLYSRCLSRNARQTMEIMADIVQNAVFPEAAFEKQKAVIIEMAARTETSASDRASIEALSRLFGPNHAAVRSRFGTSKAMARNTRDDVIDFYRSTYQPRNAVLIITGPADYSTMKPLIIDQFGYWESKEFTDLPNEVSTTRKESHAILIDAVPKPVVPFRWIIGCVGRSDREFPVALVFNALFGEGNRSLLFKKFWIERHIHPRVESSLGLVLDNGYLIITGATPGRQLDSTILLIEQAITELSEGAFLSEELESTKRSLISGEVLRSQTNREVQRVLQESVQYRTPYSLLFEEKERILAVSSQQVKTFAKAVLNDLRSSQFAIIGPYESLEMVLRKKWGDRVSIISGYRNDQKQEENE